MSDLISATIFVFPIFLIIAAMHDVTSMKIPNWISGLLIVSFFFVALATQLPVAVIGVSVALSIAILIIAMGMFAAKWIGGGDAKLLAASMLWMGATGGLPFILYTALAGGGFCLFLLTVRRYLPVLAHTGPNWVIQLMQPKGDIPYGVAIAIGALLAYPSSPLMAAFIAG